MLIDEEKKIFLGKPIREAYELEKDQNWIGGACHESIEQIEGFDTIPLMFKSVIQYKIPFKKCQVEGWAINWPKSFNSGYAYRQRLIELRDGSDLKDDEKSRSKYDNADVPRFVPRRAPR